MKSYEIEEIKDFMNELLRNEKFDSFYLYEARVKSRLDYYINGKLNEEFFDGDELDEMKSEDGSLINEYSYWKDVKSTVFDFIKGKRLPISFKIILMFNKDNIKRLIEMNGLSVTPYSVGALFLNIYYENGKLAVTTGTSLKIFTLDKTLENIWDETVQKYYI